MWLAGNQETRIFDSSIALREYFDPLPEGGRRLIEKNVGNYGFKHTVANLGSKPTESYYSRIINNGAFSEANLWSQQFINLGIMGDVI